MLTYLWTQASSTNIQKVTSNMMIMHDKYHTNILITTSRKAFQLWKCPTLENYLMRINYNSTLSRTYLEQVWFLNLYLSKCHFYFKQPARRVQICKVIRNLQKRHLTAVISISLQFLKIHLCMVMYRSFQKQNSGLPRRKISCIL